jgi:hypothetical protein
VLSFRFHTLPALCGRALLAHHKTQMKRIALILSMAFAVCANAGMVRVVAVEDGRTVTVERHGTRERIQLAGVTVLDEHRAEELLRWTIGSSWVLLEKHAGGGHLMWRSPDALFINRELVVRGYARATVFGIESPPTLNVTYLGEVDPPGKDVSATPPGTGKRTYRRSPAPPSPKTPSGRAPARGRARRSGKSRP